MNRRGADLVSPWGWETIDLPPSQTCYARAGDAEIAYQTVGSGPVDLVWAWGMMTHLEVKWEEPSLARMLERLSSFTRLILFDRRGCGLSDRGDRHLAPTLEERVQDIVAVLDAVDSRRASLFGVSEGCALAAMFASLHPERTGRIILYGGISRLIRDREHPWGVMDADQYEAAFGPVFRQWGTLEGAAAHVRLIAPSAAADADYLAWFARQQRLSLSRDAVVRFMATVTEYDLDEIFPSVRAPTLVLHRAGDSIVPTSSAQRLASRIPGARLVEVPGSDHLPYVGDASSIVEAVRDFLDLPAPPAPENLRLVTLMATDARDLETAALVKRHAHRFDGNQVISPEGERVIRFDSATRAVRCALSAVQAAQEHGTELRVAVHSGECYVDRGTVDGRAAHVVAALLRCAPLSRVVTTATVRDVVPGSGIVFTDERRICLPGLDDDILVTTVAATGPGGTTPDAVPSEHERVASEPERVFRRDGEFWTVAFEGRVVRLRDSKGMHDLAALLADPGRERHVLDLWSGATADTRLPHEASLELTSPRQQDLIDEQAREHYRRRLAELNDRETQPNPDLDEERDWLLRELASSYGVGGRERSFSDEVERARKAVYRRVADALRRVAKAHPELGRHLRNSVHTGVYCSYTPERQHSWVTSSRAGA